jgi:hypothetical protein
MRLNVLAIDQPIQHRAGAIGCIANQIGRCDAEPLFDPTDHRLGGLGLFCSVGCSRLNVHDDSSVNVDQIVG